MLRSFLCDYSYAYILVIETIAVAALVRGGGNNTIEAVFQNCAPLTNCISEINNTEIDNAKDVDAVMSMYSLIEHCENYSKTSRSLLQYYRDESALNNAGALIDFPDTSDLFKFKQKITGSTITDSAKKCFKKMVSLKYLSNFWRTLKIPCINFEANLILTSSANCFMFNAAANQAATKLYVPVVTLSTQVMQNYRKNSNQD